MTTTTQPPSGVELQLLMAAAARAADSAVPPAERAQQRVTALVLGWLGPLAAAIAVYDVWLLVRA